MSARRVAVGGCAPRWVPLHKRQSSREFAKSELQGYLGAELSSEAHDTRLADLQLYTCYHGYYQIKEERPKGGCVFGWTR